MVDNSKQHFGYESRNQQSSLELSEQSISTKDGSDEGSVEFSFPWRRHFIHSDVEYSATNRDSFASSSSGRPASTPGNFPDIHWLPPLSAVDRSQPEAVEKDSNVKNKIDDWISRLDRLISDSSQTDESSLEFRDITPELFSSQDTLTSGSSSSTELPEEDEDEEERRVASSYLSLDEVLREAVCRSTFESKDCLVGTQSEKPFQQKEAQQKETQPSPRVMYHKGPVCSDIFQACKILNTRYKLEDITVRKPVMTWSKWNVSQMVRGPHVKSPIWNPTLKRKWDRPSSIVFQELNKEITRRNEELGEIVRKKTETLQQRSASPPCLSSLDPPPSSSFPPPPPSSSKPLATSHPPSASDPSYPFNPRVPLPPCPQPEPANPLSEVNRSYFIMPEVSPRATSMTDPGGYPHATLTIDAAAAAEDEGPSSPSAGAATASSRSSSSSSGMGFLRRMVKSFWNIFLGDGGCHGEGSNSSSRSSK